MKRHCLPQTLHGRIIGLVALVSIAATVAACLAAYQEQKETYLRGIDRALLAGAFAGREVFGDEFHRRIAGGEPIGADEDRRDMEKMSAFARDLGLKHIAAVMERDGRYYYTVSSAKPLDLAVDNDALEKLRRELPDKEIFPISGVSRQGLEPLLDKLWRILEEEKSEQSVEAPPLSPI